ncbi:Chloroquine resistance transporter-related [Macleaya cordata]|uniref:Chloroquine resistance transporter-related n=1 Tax=Macleaya cordata TaxID=56857 RepID=A0A200PNH3_MACCD|nr:Chloroquine resistance transporter-related [Macleaya cordata]
MAISTSSTTFISPRFQTPFIHLSSNAIKFQPLLVSTHTPQNPRLSSRLSSTIAFNGDFRVYCNNSYFQQKFARKPKFRILASKEESHISTQTNKSRIIVGSVITVVLAVANRVLYKLALVPMKEYPFFLAQVTTFGYVAIYFSILYGRYCAGIVTKEMLALPKSRFVVIGILEALGVAAGMYSGAMLPGPTIPILNQTFLVWQLMFSSLILGRNYSFNQIVGCLLVAAGVVAAVASGSNEGQMLSGVAFMWPALMIASSAFQAGASILKEFIFIDAAKRLKGKPLDIFVVNSFGSGFQAFFVLLFLPFLSNLKGIPFAELPSYLKGGAACFLNIDCAGAPLLPLLFISTNMAFNISLLNLVKISSAVVSSLVATLAVPITIYILTLPLPYLPEGASLSPFFLVGSVILVLGLLVYYIPQPTNPSS